MGRWQRSAVAVTIIASIVGAAACGPGDVPAPQDPASTVPQTTSPETTSPETTSPETTVPGGPDPVPVWTASATSPQRTRLLAPLESSPAPASAEVLVDTSELHQRWRGVGGALTDASVELLNRAEPGLIEALFAANDAGGAALNMVRLPLSATDFSRRAWTWRDSESSPIAPPGEATAAIQTLHEIQSIGDDVEVVATAWSAPGWMKHSGVVTGGHFATTAVDAYTELLATQATALLDAGVALSAMSVVNEPGHSASDYPTMEMSDAQLLAVGRGLRSALVGTGVELWALDHNWNTSARLNSLMDGGDSPFDAVAFHCYAGTPTAMKHVAVPVLVSECTGGDWDRSWSSVFSWNVERLIADSIRSGSTGLMLWNLALDPAGGPRLGGCTNCRGIATVDPTSGTWSLGPEYYVLAHLAVAARPGAHHVASSVSAGIEAVSFLNPDGSVGVMGQNRSGRAHVVSLAVDGHETIRFDVAAGELFSGRGPAPTSGPGAGVEPCAARGGLVVGAVAATSCAVPGDIVTAPGGSAFLLQRAVGTTTAHPIPNAATLACTRLAKERRVIAITEQQRGALVLGAAVASTNCLMTGPGGDTHYINDQGRREWVPDVFTRQCEQRRGVPTITVTDQAIATVAEVGWHYCYDVETMKNTVITHPAGDSHYVDASGVRHWIPSNAVYQCLAGRGIATAQVRWREYITATPEGSWASCG